MKQNLFTKIKAALGNRYSANASTRVQEVKADESSITINGNAYYGNSVNVTGENLIVHITAEKSNSSNIREIRIHGGTINTLVSAGSVVCEHVGGSVDAGGSVTCRDVGGDVSAGGSVKCGLVGGDVDAGGSVKCCM